MAFSQSNGSISGQLLDSGTGDPLVGVTIQILGTTQGTVSDKDGKFEIYNLTIGESLDIVFSFIGFKDLKREGVIVLSNSTIDLGKISLKESPISLKAVVVTPGRFSIMGDQPLSRQTLKSEDIKNMSFAEDITRAVVRLPGVASNDFSSKFTIRGGEDDEVLITLDGMEFYEPFHQRDFAGGLFSIIDIETIQGVDLMTGGFSAEFGIF